MWFTDKLFKSMLEKCYDIEGNEVVEQLFDIVFEQFAVIYLVAGTFMIIENTDEMNFGKDSGDRTFL